MLGAGACCFWAVVDSQPADRTADYDLQEAASGWPTTAGEENTFCLDSTNLTTYYAQEDETKPFKQYYNGNMMKGYCVSAVKIAATVSAAAAAIFATAF